MLQRSSALSSRRLVLSAVAVFVLLAGACTEGEPGRPDGGEATSSIVAPDAGTSGLSACTELIALEERLVGYAIAFQNSGQCTADSDCVLVDLSISCVQSCRLAVAATDSASLKAQLLATEALECSKPWSCRVSPHCARAIAACTSGRCRTRWLDTTPGNAPSGTGDAGGTTGPSSQDGG